VRIIAIVQARMTSSRLPGKVLLPLEGKPVLAHVINRLQNCKLLDEIVVATSIHKSDNPIEFWCNKEQIKFFRGSLDDVLDRYYKAALKFNADAIVRITADCPVIDSGLVDEVVEKYLAGEYESFALAGDFPDGLDCQIFSLSSLRKAWVEAKLPSEREHVGKYIENHPNLFKSGKYFKFKGLLHHRWTLDQIEDYEFLKSVFKKLYRKDFVFGTTDILELLEREPELMKINSQIQRNQGFLKSLKNDRL